MHARYRLVRSLFLSFGALIATHLNLYPFTLVDLAGPAEWPLVSIEKRVRVQNGVHPAPRQLVVPLV